LAKAKLSFPTAIPLPLPGQDWHLFCSAVIAAPTVLEGVTLLDWYLSEIVVGEQVRDGKRDGHSFRIIRAAAESSQK
jgi:hypothetical protein